MKTPEQMQAESIERLNRIVPAPAVGASLLGQERIGELSAQKWEHLHSLVDALGVPRTVVCHDGSGDATLWFTARLRLAAKHHNELLALHAELEQQVKDWESQNFRSGHYDDFGAGQEERTQRHAEQLQEFVGKLHRLLATTEGLKDGSET